MRCVLRAQISADPRRVNEFAPLGDALIVLSRDEAEELRAHRQREQQFLAAAARGDEAAWQHLVQIYTPRVFALLTRQCGDRELAEEMTQATFVKLVVSLDRYSEQGKFEPWLFRIAMNELRDEMRRRKRRAARRRAASPARN